MANLLIGSHYGQPMTKKVEPMLLQLQMTINRSNAESDFKALALGICEGKSILRLLRELKVEVESPIKMFCDNQVAINIAKNPIHHNRTKLIEIDQHFISEKIDKKIIHLDCIPMKLGIAGILTKALPRPNFEELSHKLRMHNIYNSA